MAIGYSLWKGVVVGNISSRDTGVKERLAFATFNSSLNYFIHPSARFGPGIVARLRDRGNRVRDGWNQSLARFVEGVYLPDRVVVF